MELARDAGIRTSNSIASPPRALCVAAGLNLYPSRYRAKATIGGSSERFGYAWERYADILPHYEEQFRRWLPFFSPADWKGKRFLDAGCGMGRNSLWPMKYGAAGGVAVDIDDRTLAGARRTLMQFSSMEVRECSIYDLAWHNEFDVAFSIGVIHHLEFPEAGLEAMLRSTKPGGQVAIWVYGQENNGWFLRALDPTRKLLFSRLPTSLVHALSLAPTIVLWIMLRSGLDQIEYFRLLRALPFQHMRSIVFDQMLPRIAHYWTKAEVDSLMRSVGLEDVELAWVNEMSWAARGRKPIC
jgi:SAM-dependent methyltransferase